MEIRLERAQWTVARVVSQQRPDRGGDEGEQVLPVGQQQAEESQVARGGGGSGPTQGERGVQAAPSLASLGVGGGDAGRLPGGRGGRGGNQPAAAARAALVSRTTADGSGPGSSSNVAPSRSTARPYQVTARWVAAEQTLARWRATATATAAAASPYWPAVNASTWSSTPAPG